MDSKFRCREADGAGVPERIPFKFEFHNVVYEVVSSDRRCGADRYLRVIHGASGTFESGRLVAVMGASGSGKTSLLNLLMGRVQPKSKTSGEILLCGEERDPRLWSKQHCFLEQDDCIVPAQTVKEIIMFSVRCRKAYGREEAARIVEEVMQMLGISYLRDVSAESVSGGERKRVMLAVEFAVGADLLVFDEPTTGLDSHMAMQIVGMLKAYAAKNNRIVVMTVHQPGPGMFEMIDDLYFLHKGVVVYGGPTKELDTLFSSRGFVVPESLSRPEFMSELFSDTSVFKQVQKYKFAADQLFNERLKLSAGDPAPSRSSEYRDLTFNRSHMALLTGRAITLSLRKTGLLSLFIYAILALFLYLILCIFKFSIIYQLPNCMVGMDRRFCNAIALPKFLAKHYPLVSSCVLAVGIKNILTSVFVFIVIVYTAPAFADIESTKREIAKGTYSAVTFFWTTILVDCFFMFVLLLLYVLELVVVGFSSGILEPANVIYFLAIVPAIKIANAPFALMAEKGVLANILGGVRIFVFYIATPQLLNTLSVGTFMKYLLGCVFFPCSKLFVDVQYAASMAKQMEKVCRDIKGLSDDALTRRYTAICDVLLRGHLFNDGKSWFFGWNYPDWLSTVWITISLLLMVALGILVSVLRFSPNLRLKMSHS